MISFSFRESLDQCTKMKANFYLKENAKPLFCPKCPVPFSVIQSVEEELLRLEGIGVLKLVSYSKWVASVGVV